MQVIDQEAPVLFLLLTDMYLLLCEANLKAPECWNKNEKTIPFAAL